MARNMQKTAKPVGAAAPESAASSAVAPTGSGIISGAMGSKPEIGDQVTDTQRSLKPITPTPPTTTAPAPAIQDTQQQQLGKMGGFDQTQAGVQPAGRTTGVIPAFAPQDRLRGIVTTLRSTIENIQFPTTPPQDRPVVTPGVVSGVGSNGLR